MTLADPSRFPSNAIPAELTLLALSGVPVVEEGDVVSHIVLSALTANGLVLRPADVIVLAQKIVSKAEGRAVDLRGVRPSARAMELAAIADKDPRVVELILSESDEILRVRPGVIIVAHRLGFVAANACIDQSNIDAGDDEGALLLPRDPDESCARVREELRVATGVDVAVIIIDSIGRAWRNGTVGTAIGVSGMAGLLDLRTRPDLFGRPLKTSELALADELAAAASLMMGQAAEGRPIVVARGVPYARRDGTARELIRPKEMDLFR